jgi:hypothetical protein
MLLLRIGLTFHRVPYNSLNQWLGKVQFWGRYTASPAKGDIGW